MKSFLLVRTCYSLQFSTTTKNVMMKVAFCVCVRFNNFLKIESELNCGNLR